MTNPPSSRLTTLFQIVVVFAIVVYLLSSGVALAREVIASTKLGPHTDALSMTSHTSAEAGRIVLTNRTDLTAWGCWKGVVASVATGNKVESHVVCSGDVKPHSTTVLEAPYRVGAVLELCNKTGFGDNKVLDWSKCNFDVVDVTSAVSK